MLFQLLDLYTYLLCLPDVCFIILHLSKREHIFQYFSLKGQLTTSINFGRLSTTYLQAKQKNDQTCNDKQFAEERLSRLKQEMDNKTMIIKNIKLELERLDITE